MTQVARPNKSVLTPAKVVDAAIAMIGEGGLETFSMPKLASALGVRAPSLYHYFANKDALFEAVARTVLIPDAPTALPGDAHWTDYLISVSVTLRRTIVAHPHCARSSCNTCLARTCSTSTSRCVSFWPPPACPPDSTSSSSMA